MNHEIEVKILLTKEAFETLSQYASSVGGQTAIQTNYYYDLPDESLRQAGLTLRVRTKNGKSVLTLKAKDQKWATGAASREFDFPIESAPDTLCLADFPALLAEIQTRVSPLPETLPCLGSLTTERTCFSLPICNLTAELDKSTYFDCTDYELECELHDRSEEERYLAFLNETFSLTPEKAVCGKYHRFLNRLHEIQGK